MDTTMAVISELISSIALLGVVITLILESRQLRTSQIQASRTLNGEIIRLAMDYPSIAEVMGLEISSDDYPKYAFLGLLVDSWERLDWAQWMTRQVGAVREAVPVRAWRSLVGAGRSAGGLAVACTRERSGNAVASSFGL